MLAQAKPRAEKVKSKKQAVMARPVQAKTKTKEIGEGSTTVKAKAKQANQKKSKER